MTVSLSIQDFEDNLAIGGYGGGRFLSASTELMLISLYTYESMFRWSNDNGQPLTDEQRDTVKLWTARAQNELMEKVSIVPIGSVLPFAGEEIPDGALLCDGRLLLRVDYPDLYDVIADNLIIDANSFNVPDMEFRYPKGVEGTAIVGNRGGNTAFNLSTNNLPSHSHTTFGLVSSPITFQPGPVPLAPLVFSGTPSQTGSTGSGAAKFFEPRFTNLRYIIIAE